MSISELRRSFSKIESLLQRGEEIQITRCGKVIARLVPDGMPDFLARLSALHGNKVLSVSGAELLKIDRNRY